jgi:hypothetical protein
MAQFGRGLMQDVSNQMFERFTEALRAELEVQGAAGGQGAGGPEGRGAAASVSGPAGPPAGTGDSRRLSAGPELMTPASAPIEVSSFVLRRPGFWVAVLVVALAVLYVLWNR